MSNRLGLLLGAGVGMAAAYYLDPENGRRRRALVQDKLTHAAHQGRDSLDVARRDAGNRAYGAAASLRSSLYSDHPDDATLEARVRSSIGRAVSHPSSIEVEARDGHVRLSGPILKHETPLLIDAVYGVRGVREVSNELEEHEEPGNTPGLQGTPRRPPEENAAIFQENWTPTARLMGTLGGSFAAAYGLGHRGFAGLIASGCGLLLLGRSLGNLPVQRLVGAGAGRHAVEVQKSICIHAPLQQVFEQWENFENFPRFMRHVRNVRRIDTGRNKEVWRWTVAGPTGASFDFDTELLRREENSFLSWRTEDGSVVQHAGRVRFLDNGDGTTTADVKMSYNPPAGAMGHILARLFSADPKHQLDSDLMRMKTFIESGREPHDAAAHRGEQPRREGEWLSH